MIAFRFNPCFVEIIKQTVCLFYSLLNYFLCSSDHIENTKTEPRIVMAFVAMCQLICNELETYNWEDFRSYLNNKYSKPYFRFNESFI